MRLLLVPLVLLSSCRSSPIPTDANPPRTDLIIATYNVNFGADPDLAPLRATAADIILLQETTPAWEEAIRAGLADEYPHMAFRHCCRAGGLAVLSRAPLTAHDYLDSPTGWFPAWRFVADTHLGRIQLLDVHLHPPVTESGNWAVGWFTTGAERRAEIEAYVPALEADLPTVIAGDFNEPTDGAAWDFLHDRGFESALGAREPDRRTWRWPGPLGELSAQLDHVAHDARLHVVEARVLELGPSDHFPLVVTFARAPPAPEANAH